MVELPHAARQARESRTWWSPAPSSGSTTWPQWKERSFFQDHLWVISDMDMEAGIMTFIWFLVCSLWLLLSQWLSCLVQFHLRGRGWTNFSPCSMTEMIQDHHLICTSRLWVTWDIYIWELLCHPEAVLSGLGLSESVVFHVVSWVSILGCVGLVLVGLFCCFCVCVVLKTNPRFLLSPILQHVGIAYLRQNVLMTVWASSAHGMSSKKKSSPFSSFVLLRPSSFILRSSFVLRTSTQFLQLLHRFYHSASFADRSRPELDSLPQKRNPSFVLLSSSFLLSLLHSSSFILLLLSSSFFRPSSFVLRPLSFFLLLRPCSFSLFLLLVFLVVPSPCSFSLFLLLVPSSCSFLVPSCSFFLFLLILRSSSSFFFLLLLPSSSSFFFFLLLLLLLLLPFSFFLLPSSSSFFFFLLLLVVLLLVLFSFFSSFSSLI